MIVNALIPIYILIAIGFVAIKTGYVSDEAIRPINLFVIKVFLPVLIFLVVFQTAQETDYNWNFIIGYGVACVVTQLLIFIALNLFFNISVPHAFLFSLGSAGSNTIFIGFPLVSLLFVSIAEVSFAWVLLVENIFLIPVTLLLYDAFAERGKNARQLIFRIISNPIFLSMALGVTLPFLFSEIWAPLLKSLTLMRNVSAGIVLVLIGGMFARATLRGNKKAIALVVFGKLILHPFLVLITLMLFGVSGELLLAAICYASVSVFAIYANLCELAEQGEFGSSVFLVTTLLAPLTISMWLIIAERLLLH